MLTTSLMVMLVSYFRPCQASPIFEEPYYHTDFVPQTVEAYHGLQIVAPDSPYIAAAGINKLYFIDKRFDEETAFHIKQQIEHASIPRSGEYIKSNEFEAQPKCGARLPMRRCLCLIRHTQGCSSQAA